MAAALRRADPFSPTAPTLHRAGVRGARDSGAARAADVERGARLTAGPPGRGHDRARLGRNRALRHLVQRFLVAQYAIGGGARRDHRAGVIRRARPTRRTSREMLMKLGLPEETRRVSRRAHRRRAGARLGPRHRPPACGATGAPAHARRKRRHELQGLQHRGPRDGAQRRAGVLALTTSTTRCCRRAATPPSPRRWRSSSRRATSSCSACQPDAEAQRAARRSTISGRPTKSPASRSWRSPSGTGCTTHPTPRPRSCARRACRSPKDVWNTYYAPVFGKQDVALLGIYSHMVNYPLYLPDYPIGHMIAFQIEEQVEKSRRPGRRVRAHVAHRGGHAGSLDDDGGGRPVGPQALLRATEAALKDLNAKR